MSTRRRVGFSTSTSEASRRQLMQPVPCWEKVWALPDNAVPGSTLKVYKWVKTDKKQQFSDDEGETDEPLAPLPEPEDVEIVEGDDEMDQDEAATASLAPDTAPVSRDVSEPIPSKEDTDVESKPVSPKPHPLSISFQPPTPTPDDDALLLDMADIGPDGEQFEAASDLSQLQPTDALLGGPLMDEEMEDLDPFAIPPA
ncbi:hypothetical protein A0H81_03236 [Grifola frondosa]|uniref:Uncharacterized protein n=1 Tax=Grifola frondosa TaxID=5627 RepID=A0A1C7MGY2_GRIFR|nr:hypothetical protein A0H81_03236 [Grifola frondosa]